MTQRTYRTAQGKVVDLGALQLKNENVRAVGNMSVNARGELIDSANRPIQTRNEQVGRQYKKQTNVSDDAVVSSKKSRSDHTFEETANLVFPDEIDNSAEYAEPVAEETTETEESPAGGLAAAIARARQIKQESLKTPRQVAQAKAGVKKI